MHETVTTEAPLLRAIPTLAEIGIGRTKAYELLNSGELPAVKIGKSTFIRRSDWSRFIATLPIYQTTGAGKGEPA